MISRAPSSPITSATSTPRTPGARSSTTSTA
jgi:hypothetical protein